MSDNLALDLLKLLLYVGWFSVQCLMLSGIINFVGG